MNPVMPPVMTAAIMGIRISPVLKAELYLKSSLRRRPTYRA